MQTISDGAYLLTGEAHYHLVLHSYFLILLLLIIP